MILFSLIPRSFRFFRKVIKRSLRQLTKPDNHSLALNAALDMTRCQFPPDMGPLIFGQDGPLEKVPLHAKLLLTDDGKTLT